jgi:enoyl-CoA hydratase
VSEQRIRYEDREGVARLHWDDGKANAVSSEALAELNGCVERAEKDEAKAIALIGRPGVFCAGFDLAELGRGGDATRKLVRGGAELLIRLGSTRSRSRSRSRRSAPSWRPHGSRGAI